MRAAPKPRPSSNLGLAEERDALNGVMSINFNLWFVKDGLIKSGAIRTWIEDVDWVFHQARAILTPAEVEARVAGMRERNIRFTDTVPDQVPPLPSPCNF